MSGPRCYVLHIDPPYFHAKHYTGIAIDGDVPRRFRQHISGQGSPLIRAAVAAGCQVRITLDVPGDRHRERQLHNMHGTRVCPECKPRRRRAAGRQLRLFSSTGAAHAAAPTPSRLAWAA